MNKEERLKAVNEMLEVIASCGRKFFADKGQTSRMEVDTRGRVWFVDSYSGKRIYTHCPFSKWRGFTNGGTLKSLICHFRDFIVKSKPVPLGCFGPWPEWYCDGDLWGYGDDMEGVRKAAIWLGIVNEQE